MFIGRQPFKTWSYSIYQPLYINEPVYIISNDGYLNGW